MSAVPILLHIKIRRRSKGIGLRSKELEPNSKKINCPFS